VSRAIAASTQALAGAKPEGIQASQTAFILLKSAIELRYIIIKAKHQLKLYIS
jgi:hypothetical protein